jgi:hypothetical protein
MGGNTLMIKPVFFLRAFVAVTANLLDSDRRITWSN